MPRCREVINMKKDIRITVLYGGPSAERAVSLVSGAPWLRCAAGWATVLRNPHQPGGPRRLETLPMSFFRVLHGSFGEDGQLQAILERRELCYVGSDAAASRLAIDKDAAKHCWQRAGLPTAAWLTRSDTVPCPLILAPHFPLPAVVSPPRKASSVGVRLCDTMEDLQQAVLEYRAGPWEGAHREAVDRFRITVGILGGRPRYR